jgi:predicted Zn-dependent protease
VGPAARLLVTALLCVAVPPAAVHAQRRQPADAPAVPSADVARLRTQVQQVMEASRFDEAEALCQQLLALTPDDPIAHMQLGIARAMGGRAAAALPPLREALRRRPDLVTARLFLGIAHVALGRPGEAIAPLRQVLRGDAKNVAARQALAEALSALDRHAEASAHLKVLAGAQPGSPQVWAGLARSYEGITRETFAKLQAADPDSPYVWLLTADVLIVEEKYPAAFSLIRKAQQALPDLPGVHRTLAAVYAGSGHAEWAAVEAQRARDEQPACTTLPVACAYLAGKLDEVLTRTATATATAALYWRARAANDLAGQAFDRLDGLPPSIERHLVRAGIARDQNRPLDAVAELREALKLAPGDPGLEGQLAVALHAARDYDAALPLLEKLHRRSPEAPDVLAALGDTLLQLQQLDRAVALLTKAAAAMPGSLGTQASLGRALLQAGDAAQAAVHLEKALPADHDGSTYYQLAQALQRTGQADRARVLLAEYQKRSQAAAPAETPAESPAITSPVP